MKFSKYNIRRNWQETIDFMMTKPIVIMPFIIIAFLECLVLELLFFSTRPPVSYVTNPIIRKFFGDAFLHYPGNFILLPKLFYYGQVLVYVFCGAFLTAVAVNIYKNLAMELPLKAKALFKNAFKNYISFFGYAIIVTTLFFILRNTELYVFEKIFNKIARLLPFSISSIYKVLTILLIFVTNLIFQVLFILTIPLIVLEKMKLFKAIIKSIYLGVRKFSTIFILISLPFFIYFPVLFLKSFANEIMDKTFPEVNLLISIAGIVLSIFLDCFSLLCVSKFLFDWLNNKKAKAS